MAFINVKKCLTEPKQLIKLLVLVICVCITIYQLSDCVAKLLRPPISTYYKFYLNETIKYPSLTICRKPAYKTAIFPKYGIREFTQLQYDKAFIDFPFENHTIEEFLEETTYSLRQTAPLYAFGGSGQNSDVEIKSTFLVNHGQCHIFIPKVNSAKFSEAGGYFLYFRHNVWEKETNSYGISTSGFDIYMHDSNEILTSEEEQENSFMEYVYLESSEDMRVTLNLQSFSQVSTSSEPCVSDATYSKSKCQEECIHKQIAQKVGCVLPWLRVNESLNLPQCSDYPSVTALISGFNDLNRSIFLQNCHCLISCNITIYSSHIQSRKDADQYLRPGSVIIIYYSSNLVTQMEEILGYDWNTFLADIGGSMGFLLGLSVIGIITILEQFIRILINKRKVPKTIETVNGIKNNNETKSSEDIAMNQDDGKNDQKFKNIMDFYEKQSVDKSHNDNNKY